MRTTHRTATASSAFLDGRLRRSLLQGAVLVAATVLVLAGGIGVAAAATSAPSESVGKDSARSLGAEAATALAGGRTGRAILAYERALLLAPRAPALEAGLKQARSAAGVPEEEPSAAVRALRLLSANEWSRFAAGAAGLASAAFVAFAWGERPRWLIATTLASLTVCGLALGAAMAITPPRDVAIVVAADALTRIAPFPHADPEFVEPEGATVTVKRTHGNFALVQDARGSGWLPLDKLERLFPASAPAAAAHPHS